VVAGDGPASVRGAAVSKARRQRRPTGEAPPLPHPVAIITTAWLVLAAITLAGAFAAGLPDGYQPAMMVMAAPCAVAAIVTGLFVSHSRTAAPGLAPPPRCHGCVLPVLDQPATT
jgi:hypothetical protein